jgi:hypothetical protein
MKIDDWLEFKMKNPENKDFQVINDLNAESGN